MAIKANDLSVKVGSGEGVGTTQASSLIWDDIEEGMYDAELVIVYPWKQYTKDTKVRIKDDEGKYIKDADGKFVTEDVKDLTWYSTDIVFKILGSLYDGYAVKGSLSTHPSMIGSAKRFLYAAKIFDVELKDLSKQTGAKVKVYIKNKVEEYRDKNTGLDVVKNSPYASYYERFEEETKE